MKFGLHYGISCTPDQNPVQRYRDTLEQATYAEDLGFDSVWPLEQHFFPELSHLSAPLLLLSALAERTRTLRLGTAVVVLPFAHPLRVAEEIATLDVLSNGRVEFGVGRGTPQAAQSFGISENETRDRLVEGLEMIRQAWTRDRFSFDGRFFKVEDLVVVPRPVQRPHPPIRVAANGTDSFALFGQLGYPILAALHMNPLPKLRELVSVYDEARRAGGHPARSGEDLTLLVPLYVGESEAQIRQEVEPNIKMFQAAFAAAKPWTGTSKGIGGVEVARRFTYENLRESMAIFDTPDVCAERLHSIQQALNVGRVICWFNMGGLIPHHRVMRSMELFAAKVMPQLCARG